MIQSTDLCALCGGRKVQRQITVTVDLGTNLLVIRNIPALICELCGEEWVDNQHAQAIERMSQDAIQKQRQVEIVTFVAS